MEPDQQGCAVVCELVVADSSQQPWSTCTKNLPQLGNRNGLRFLQWCCCGRIQPRWPCTCQMALYMPDGLVHAIHIAGVVADSSPIKQLEHANGLVH